MTKFKVGEIVVLNKIENAYGEETRSAEMPMTVRIRSIEESGENKVYDYGVETLEGDWVSNVYERNLTPALGKVEKQTIIRVGERTGLLLQHTTNTKKNKVSIQRTGSKIGTIKIDDIDVLIGLLTKLKTEV